MMKGILSQIFQQFVRDAEDVDSLLKILSGNPRAEYCIQMLTENITEKLANPESNLDETSV